MKLEIADFTKQEKEYFIHSILSTFKIKNYLFLPAFAIIKTINLKFY